MGVLAFFGWIGVFVLVTWRTAYQLPAGYGNALVLAQLAGAIASGWFIAMGLPSWIDPTTDVVVSGGPGRPNRFTRWSRAKGRRYALTGVAVFAVANLAGWGLEHAIGLPARHARRIAATIEPSLLADRQGLDACLRTVWTRGPHTCRLRYEVTAVAPGARSGRASLAEALCTSPVVATCARMTRDELVVPLLADDHATIAYAGDLEVTVLLPLLRGSGPRPRVEQAP